MNAKEKIFTKDFCLILASTFFSAMVMYMLMTTITEYAASFGVAASLAGLVSGIYVIGGLMSRLYSGGGQAKYGWKRIALVFLSLHFVACCCYFLTHSIGSLLAIRFLHGLGFGAGSNAVLTVGTYTLPKSRYGEAMGYLMLPATLAIAVGPFAGGLIYDAFGSTGCFAAAAVCAFFALLFAFLIKVPNDVSIAPPAADGRGRGLSRVLEVQSVPLAFCITLLALGYVAVMSFYRLYSAETGLEREFSYFFLIYAAVLLAARPLMGMVQDRFGDNLACCPGLILQGIGLILLGAYPSMPTIVFCAFGCAMGYGALSAGLNAIISGHALPERRTYAVSTFYALCDTGVGVGPFLLGVVQSVSGSYHMIYFVSGALALLTLPWYYFVWGKKGDTASPRRHG
ncbi:MAG: MFS transporter [Oscillospiraceae bacterium]|nr:MFS transporter [Oscillospiraceae bacterium]